MNFSADVSFSPVHFI